MFHFVNNFFTVAPICIFFIFYLTIADKSDIIEMLCYAPVAQLDRAIASDAMCRRFKSGRVYHVRASLISLALIFYAKIRTHSCRRSCFIAKGSICFIDVKRKAPVWGLFSCFFNRHKPVGFSGY